MAYSVNAADWIQSRVRGANQTNYARQAGDEYRAGLESTFRGQLRLDEGIDPRRVTVNFSELEGDKYRYETLLDGKPYKTWTGANQGLWDDIKEVAPYGLAIWGGALGLQAALAGSAGAGAGVGTGASLNPALIESAVGTSGYGASSAGLGGAAAGAGGLGYIPASPGAALGGVGVPAETAGFQLGQMAGGLPAAGAGGGSTLNPALIESMVGTPGYGLSSAGLGGGAGTLAGLAPLVDAVPAIPGLGAGTPAMSLGSALLDFGGAAAGSLRPVDWLHLLASGYNWMQADKLQDAAGRLDPFGAYRADYARQLADLMANPGNVTKLPGYTAAQSAAEQALTRNLAAQGLTGSGAAAEALAKFGGEFQNQFYQQQLATLAGLSGANFNNAGLGLQAEVAGTNAQNRIFENLLKILPFARG